MATSTTSSRESRRRKILERGSDRLAFITGRSPAFDPSPSLHHTHSHSHSDNHQDLPTPNSSIQAPAPAPASPDVHDKAASTFSPALPDPDLHPAFNADQSQTCASNGGIIDESMLQRDGTGTGIEPLKDPALDAAGEVNPLPYSLDDQSSFISTSGSAQHTETPTQKHSFFSPKQISSAIDASERMRILCSIIMAVLVVLSHLGFPLLGSSFLGSIVSFRPLYFVLLTNLTVVIARLLGGSERTSRVVNKNPSSSGDEHNFAEQLSKTLELGLVAQKAIDAVFMDCSIYAIVVICGLSLT